MRLAIAVLGMLVAAILIVPAVLAQGDNDVYLPFVQGPGSGGPTATIAPTQPTDGAPTATETSTATLAATATLTATVTPTSTVTITPTSTVTSTNTPTGTVTPPTPTSTPTGTITPPTPTDTPTNTPTGTITPPTPTDTPTNTPTSTVTPPTPTNTPTATSTVVIGPTATNTPTNTPTGTPTNTPTVTPTPIPTTIGCQVAPPDAGFNAPLDIPLDSTLSVLDFVSFPNGDTFDRSRYSVTGMNPNPGLSGGRARLVISVSCFGTGIEHVQITTGGNTFSCGQTVVDREVTADSDTGTINIEAVGGECTYVQWVLTGTATRIN